MEFAQTLILFIWMILLMETGIIMWARSMLTNKDSTKTLFDLTFNSDYRFLWWPKLAAGSAALICLMVSFYEESESSKVKIAILAFVLMAIDAILVVVEAVRTKE